MGKRGTTMTQAATMNRILPELYGLTVNAVLIGTFLCCTVLAFRF